VVCHNNGGKPSQRQSRASCLRELHLVVEFGEANDVPAAVAAITVEQVLERIDQKAWFMIFVQRTQSQESTPAEPPGRPPIMGL
jgi:hypothetical protein